MRPAPTLLAMLLSAAPASAQVRVEVQAPGVTVAPPPAVRVAAPTVQFVAPPPLVVVQPGVQVVRDYEREIFFVDGFYWYAGPDGWWYRTRTYRGGWVAVHPSRVPGRLINIPRGRYVRWHGDHDRDDKWQEKQRKLAEQDRERWEKAQEKEREHWDKQREHEEKANEKAREHWEKQREKDRERGEKRRDKRGRDD